MKKQTIKGNIVIAEDVRAEIDGRFSIIGAIPSALMVQKPKSVETVNISLAVYSEFIGNNEVSSVLIQLLSPDDVVIAQGNVPPPAISPDSDTKGFVVAGKFQNVSISKEGLYKFLINTDGVEHKKNLRISFSE